MAYDDKDSKVQKENTQMILTEKMLQEYIQQNRISITKEKTQEILQVLGNEPDNHYEWSEQDLIKNPKSSLKPILFFQPSKGSDFEIITAKGSCK